MYLPILNAIIPVFPAKEHFSGHLHCRITRMIMGVFLKKRHTYSLGELEFLFGWI